jgi:hypothetical protein
MSSVNTYDKIKTDIYEHCLGKDNPFQHILDNGRFPRGWVDKYMTLLGSIIRIWGDAPECPREVYSSIHYASFHLSERYDAWHKLRGLRNKKTEISLAKLRSISEVFLLGKII